MSHTADCYHTETVSAKAATEYATVAPTTSASADTDITNRADDVPAVAWYQRACAEASNDKVAASDAKADVNSIRGFAAMRAVITKATRIWENESVRRHFQCFRPFYVPRC